MPLETGTYISDLNASNPVGSTDKVQTLDDHVRLLKSTIKASFPGVTGAVTPTHTELNFVDGVTSAIQTQLDGKAASSHAHSAADLTSGTIPDARFPATLPAASGVNLTALNGTNIASGTVADARLSSNVPLKDAANAFTAAEHTWSRGGTVNFNLNNTSNSIELDFGVGSTQAYAIVATNHPFDIYTNNTHRLRVAADGGFDFKGGTVTTNNASASEVGYKGAPQNAQTSNYTLALTDLGKTVRASPGCSQVTVPDDAAVDFPIGAVIRIHNRNGGTLTITKTTSTGLILNGTSSTTGARTLTGNSVCEVYKSEDDEWIISGPVS